MSRSIWALALIAACSTKQPDPKPSPQEQADAARIAELRKEIASEVHIGGLHRDAAMAWHIVAELRGGVFELADRARAAKTDADRAAAKTALDEMKTKLEKAERDAKAADDAAKAAELEYVHSTRSAGSGQQPAGL